MAATNPFRSSDLVAKYGWKAMIYLSNLGPQLLSEAQVLFVDSGHTNALDADDTEHGHSFERPLATIDYAIGLCTAEERSVILVAPGHNESLDASTIDFDVSDITVIGIGEGSNRPTIDFDSTDAQVIIGANNVHLINLRFMPSIDDIVIGVEVEAAKTGTILEKCEWAEAEEAGDEFILGLDIKAGCTDTKVTNCLFRTEVGADACTHAIKLTGASDNVIVEKSRFIGNWSTAAIGGDGALSTDVLLDNLTIKTRDDAPGIKMLTGTTGIIRNVCIEATDEAVDVMIVADTMAWFNNYGVTVDGKAAELIGGGEVNAQMIAHGLDHLVTLADGEAVRPASVVQDSILAKIMGSPDPATIATYDNTTDSLEAISDQVSKLDGVTLNVTPVAASIATFLAGGAGGQGTQLPTSTSLYDSTKNVSVIGVTAAPVEKTLSDILHKDGEFTYDNTDDSLEAIRDRMDTLNLADQVDLDAILADTISISGATLPDAPESGSLATFISGGSVGLGRPLPASTSLIDIIGNFTGGYAGVDQDDNIKASLDLAHVELAKIKDQAVCSGITYFVDSTAVNDDGNGLSWATAKKTIQAAVTLATTYTTIYIKGIFDESVVTKIASDCLSIIGAGGESKVRPYWSSAETDESALTIQSEGCVVDGIWFQGGSKTVPFILVTLAGANMGVGSVIKNCRIVGAGSSISAICYCGGSISNKLLNNHITGFGAANTGYQAAVYGDSYVQSACDFEIVGNFFTENTDHVRLQMCTCLVKDNVFQSEGNVLDATVKLDTVCSGEDVGGNCVVDNYFGDVVANIKNTEGYYGTVDDLWSGNHCTDADDWGVPAAA